MVVVGQLICGRYASLRIGIRNCFEFATLIQISCNIPRGVQSELGSRYKHKQMRQRIARRGSDWQRFRGISLHGWTELFALFLLITCFTARVTRPKRVHFHAYQSRTSTYSRFTDGYEIRVEVSSKVDPHATSTLIGQPRSLSLFLPDAELVRIETTTAQISPCLSTPSLRAPPPSLSI